MEKMAKKNKARSLAWIGASAAIAAIAALALASAANTPKSALVPIGSDTGAATESRGDAQSSRPYASETGLFEEDVSRFFRQAGSVVLPEGESLASFEEAVYAQMLDAGQIRYGDTLWCVGQDEKTTYVFAAESAAWKAVERVGGAYVVGDGAPGDEERGRVEHAAKGGDGGQSALAKYFKSGKVPLTDAEALQSLLPDGLAAALPGRVKDFCAEHGIEAVWEAATVPLASASTDAAATTLEVEVIDRALAAHRIAASYSIGSGSLHLEEA